MQQPWIALASTAVDAVFAAAGVVYGAQFWFFPGTDDQRLGEAEILDRARRPAAGLVADGKAQFHVGSARQDHQSINLMVQQVGQIVGIQRLAPGVVWTIHPEAEQ